uniref:Intramembrane protease 2 n=3 Tax=Loa loa TaxID=7209 RepID=A0A1I7VGC5_LOALO
MDCVVFTALNTLVILAALIIYAGCRRSYSIYFFERDVEKVVFLEDAGAVMVPIVLSAFLIILYRNSKLSGDNGMEKGTAQRQLSQSRTSNISHQVTGKMHVKLDRISEASLADTVAKICSTSHTVFITHNTDLFISGNGEEMKTTLNEDLPEGMENANGPSSEECLVSDGNLPNPSVKAFREELAQEREEVSENVGEAASTDGIHQKSPSFRRRSLRRESSTVTDYELAVEHKRSEIYRKISKISFLPSVDKVVTVVRCSSVNISKRSVLDVLGRVIIIHIPIWLGVIAVQITMVEVFDNKFYHLFYYHHPKMKQLAMIIAILLGLFHELKWTWVVNDILGIATCYIIIARTETASYFAGFIFLIGMILFDIFWFYCIDLFSVVTMNSRTPIMLIIPVGKERRPVRTSTVDIVVPGIFLNIILKFAEMYDTEVFFLSFYACIFGMLITALIIFLRRKSTPAIVLPGIFAILASMLSVENPSNLWRFGIKH